LRRRFDNVWPAKHQEPRPEDTSAISNTGFKPQSQQLAGNSVRQTVHTHRASVHQAAKLVAALLMVAGVTAGLVESNTSLPPGLCLTSPAG